MFIGVTLAWQILFLLMSTDPVRYRPAMPVAVLEKAAFAVAAPILFAMQRVGAQTLAFAMIDGLLGVLLSRPTFGRRRASRDIVLRRPCRTSSHSRRSSWALSKA